jgi:hypothetical protein
VKNLCLGRVIKNLGLGRMLKGGQKQVLQRVHSRRLQLISQMGFWTPELSLPGQEEGLNRP